MRSLCITIFLGALVSGMQAETVDVSMRTAQLLQSGDALTFLFTDASYAQLALGMGMAPYPSQIFFDLISAPVGAAGQFTVELESQDKSAGALFPGPVQWTSGVVATSGYSGPASVLTDSLALSSMLSQQIFADSHAELIFTYTGPDVTVGLPGYSLKDDLSISLTGGPLSIGAMDYDVTLSNGLGGATAPSGPNSTAPEPNSAALTFGAGMLLCAISLALKRFGRPE
jgi:hypothetical protein